MTSKIVQYRIFSSEHLSDKVFSERINTMICQGWQPLGGICWNSTDGYAQALVKYANA